MPVETSFRSSQYAPARREDLSKTDLEMTESTKTEQMLGEHAEFQPQNLIKEDDEHRDVIEVYRVKIQKVMHTSLFGQLYENLLITAAIFSGCQYISSTYHYYLLEEVLNAYQTIEIVLAVIFSWDWVFCFFLADNKIMFSTSFYSMIDLLTVIPIWVTRSYPCMDYNNINTPADTIVYILCAITSTRILRSLRIRRKLMRIEDEVTRALTDIGLNIIIFVLYFAALMQFLEQQDAVDVSTNFETTHTEFHSWCYYIMVTMTSVGYGDISPKSTWGRVLAMAMICMAFIAGPQMSGNLVEKMEEKSVYARSSYVAKYRATHVFICGDITTTAILPFVLELFHEDHEDENIHAVFMSPNLPNGAMRGILRDPMLSHRVTYLEGSVLSDADLKRGHVANAVSIFIMANKFTYFPDEEDANIILQQFALKKFIMHEQLPNKPLFAIQLIRPENKRYLIDSSELEGPERKDDIILCLNEIKMGIIAKAVMYPGSNTLLMNLLTSFADDEDEKEEEEVINEKEKTEMIDNETADNWLGEYQQGCGWEVYTTKLNPMFSGVTFATLAEILYQRMGVVLFGLLVEDLRKGKSHARMLLNPADFVIPPHDDCSIDAFVIAENKNASDLSFSDTHTKSDGKQVEASSNLNILAAAVSMSAGQISSTSTLSMQSPASPSAGAGASAAKTKQKAKAKTVIKVEQEWQKVLRQNTNRASLDSEQELDKKVDLEYLRTNYYTLNAPASIGECTIVTSVALEAPYVSQHTLIMGKKISSLYDLIRPLRATTLSYLRPIVIMSPEPISEAVWSRISIFQGIFVILGSLLEEHDMVRAGALTAAQCILLADSSGLKDDTDLTAGAKATMVALVDADAIFAFNTIKSLNIGIKCCIEIINAQNVSFIDSQEGLSGGDVDYKFTPPFASGVLLNSSFLDTIICQAFYNRHIVGIIQLFASSAEIKDRRDIVTETMGSLTQETKKGVAAVLGSTLYQMKLPEDRIVHTYGELFRSLTKQGIVPLGLYRGVFKHLKQGPKQNRQPYVFTNPPKEVELFSCDRVFVLSQKPIVGKERGLTRRKDWSLVRNIAEDPLNKISLQLDSIKDSQRRRLELVDKKLDDVVAAIKETWGEETFAKIIP